MDENISNQHETGGGERQDNTIYVPIAETTAPLTSDILVDDDINHTITKLVQDNQNVSVEAMTQTLCEAVQAERNHWKHKVNSAIQEINRQHKLLLAHQTHLQDFTTLLNLPQKLVTKPELIPEDSIVSGTGTPSTESIVSNLRRKIKHIQHLAGITDESEVTEPGADTARYSEQDLKYLKNAVAKYHWENESAQAKVKEREQEVEWLKSELDMVNNNYRKLQGIITQYNSTHAGASFHLEVSNEPIKEEVEVESYRSKSTARMNSDIKVRKYVEGERLFSCPGGKDDPDFWRRRQHANNKKSLSRTGVAKCLRCNKLFKPSDNSHKSCKYHSKGREIKEMYDSNGKIVNVSYKWACCKKGIDALGCTYGPHM